MLGSIPLRGFEIFQETEEDIVCCEIMMVTNKRLEEIWASGQPLSRVEHEAAMSTAGNCIYTSPPPGVWPGTFS